MAPIEISLILHFDTNSFSFHTHPRHHLSLTWQKCSLMISMISSFHNEERSQFPNSVLKLHIIIIHHSLPVNAFVMVLYCTPRPLAFLVSNKNTVPCLVSLKFCFFSFDWGTKNWIFLRMPSVANLFWHRYTYLGSSPEKYRLNTGYDEEDEEDCSPPYVPGYPYPMQRYVLLLIFLYSLIQLLCAFLTQVLVFVVVHLQHVHNNTAEGMELQQYNLYQIISNQHFFHKHNNNLQ